MNRMQRIEHIQKAGHAWQEKRHLSLAELAEKHRAEQKDTNSSPVLETMAKQPRRTQKDSEAVKKSYELCFPFFTERQLEGLSFSDGKRGALTPYKIQQLSEEAERVEVIREGRNVEIEAQDGSIVVIEIGQYDHAMQSMET